MNFFNLPSSEKEAVQFLQEHGELQSVRICPNNHLAKLYFGKEIFWKCNVKKCQKKVNIRNGNWFSKSRIPFTTAVRFIYGWSHEMTSIKWCEQQFNLSENTVIDWNNYLREVCAMAIENKQQGKIGGPGLIVEIDESLFSKRKNHAGRVLPEQWIFGGICRETKESFLMKVPNRQTETLLTAVKNNIQEGTTIYSDCWRAYNTELLRESGFDHYTVNHTYNFVDPTTGAHTQTIERFWGSAKWRNKKQRGTARHHLESYLTEFIWRQATQDPFSKILMDITTYFPPQKNY